MGLGNAELEPIHAGISLSALEGRSIFAKYIYYHARPAVDDLLRLYNPSLIPTEKFDQRLEPHQNYLTTVFLHSLLPLQTRRFLTDRGIPKSANVTPVVELLKFMRSKEHRFDEECVRVRARLGDNSSSYSERMINRAALDALIPNYSSLSATSGLARFRKLVDEWSVQWSLSDDWCVDLALNAVKAFVCRLAEWRPLGTDELSNDATWWLNGEFLTRSVQTSWIEARDEFGDEQFGELLKALAEIPDNPEFSFHWSPILKGVDRSFRIEDRHTAYSFEKEDFRRRVEQAFWFNFFNLYERTPALLVGNLEKVKDRMSRLLKKMDDYLAECRKVQRGHGRPRKSKPSGDRHFRWAVLFQVNRLNVHEVVKDEIDRSEGAKGKASVYTRTTGVETDLEEEEGELDPARLSPSTVREGIQDVAKLIGLTLRRGKRGRPKGRRDADGVHRRRINN